MKTNHQRASRLRFALLIVVAVLCTTAAILLLNKVSHDTAVRRDLARQIDELLK